MAITRWTQCESIYLFDSLCSIGWKHLTNCFNGNVADIFFFFFENTNLFDHSTRKLSIADYSFQFQGFFKTSQLALPMRSMKTAPLF